MPILSIIQLILTGAVAGFAAGFMGIGGGAILTPLCLIVYPALGISSEYLVHIIFGTNMFLVMVFSISAVQKHHMNRKIDWRTVAIMGPLAMIGSLTGTWLASIADTSTLKKALAVVLLFSSALITIKGSSRPKGKAEGGKPLVSRKLLPLLGLIVGTAGAFMGIGGGAIMIPVLILVFALPTDRVAGTSSSVIIFIGFVGTLGFMWNGQGLVDLPGWSTGYVWWSAAIPLAVGGIPMARVGAWINSRTQVKILQRMFGLVLLVIALKMLFF